MAKFLKGTRIPHRKGSHMSPTVKMPIPDMVRIPMLQHMGRSCEPLVKKGDIVLVGQPIGDCDAYICAPIHSSVSGTVTKIGELIKPDGQRIVTVDIQSDKEQTLYDKITPPIITSHKDFVKAIRDSGLVGLGGAGFPTHVKFNPPNLEEVHTLIINAAECEPYITSDNQTMIESTENLMKGIQAVLTYLDLSFCYIAVEDNKPEAIAKMNELAAADKRIQVKVLPAVFPQGAEKVIIYHTFDGLIVPEGKLPADVGVIVNNVTTIALVGQYLTDGIPLIRKRVTVDGSAIASPQNVMVPIGTSVADLIAFTGGYKGTPAKTLMGGPMMGLALLTDDYPTMKYNNAIISFNNKEATRYEETSCMSCGRCVRTCPMNLMPLLMKEATEKKDIPALGTLKVNLCIECGSCAYVCPARQELIAAHRLGKEILKQDDQKDK